jgi:predicted nucleotidyltransferase
MPYNLIDEIIKKQEADREEQRKQVLSNLKEILKKLSLNFGFSKAYIFGSVVKPKKFHNRSDIDIAVFGLKNQHFFSLMGEFSRCLLRDVDLYQVENLDEYLRKRIEEEGELWIKQD